MTHTERDRSEDYLPGTMVHAYVSGVVVASGELLGYEHNGDARIRTDGGRVLVVNGDNLARSGL